MDVDKNKKQNLVEIEAYLKPSWVLASTNMGFNLEINCEDLKLGGV
jgi:hypothetical protein